MRNVNTSPWFFAAVMWLACCGTSIAANTSFLNDSAVAEFKDADVTMLQANIDQALALPEGETKVWENPPTGAHGRITVLGTHSRDGRECRKLRVENHARGRSGEGDWNYCRTTEGRWELTFK